MANQKSPYLAYTNDNPTRLGNMGFGSGRDDGNGGDMEARVQRLEDDIKEVKTDLKAIRQTLSDMTAKVNNLPATWQLIAINAAMLGLVLASAALTFAALRQFTPIP